MRRCMQWVMLSGLGMSLCLVGAQARAAGANQSPERAQEPTVTKTEMLTMDATVENIDKANRMVTVKSDQGDRYAVRVPETVKGIDRIKKGDRIRMSYYESLAVAVQQPGQKPMKARETVTAVAGKGGQYGRQVTTTVEIITVDTSRNMVTFRAANGQFHTVTVKDPDMRQRLGELKPGQNLQITFTEAVAATMEPVPTAR